MYQRLRLGRVALGLFLLAFSFSAMPPATAADGKSVNVFAASSLQVQYIALAEKFQAAHPGVKINISFGSSATLANQIAAGAPVDIFVSADQASMAVAKTKITNPTDYVLNHVVLAVPTNSRITKTSDLNGNVKWIQCAHTAPCGIAADRALAAEGVKGSPVSYEVSASSTLAKLLAGAVDAAIVFKTDVIANKSRLRAIEFADAQSASSQYQIGIAKSAVTKKNRWANTFLVYLKSSYIRKALSKAGFQVDLLK
jgi:molybdate transport system substrate-binding protein